MSSPPTPPDSDVPLPGVTVVIPCYNSRAYLGEALDSALDQDYENLEVIVIDDGSTDGSHEIIERYADRVRSVRTPNRGVSAARNLGISMATGTYLQFLDSDDLILPGKIRRQVETLETTGADAVIGDYLRLVGSDRIAPLNVHRRESFDSIDEFVMYTLHLIGRCLYRTGIVREAGGFPPFRRSEDFAFHFQLIAIGARWVYEPDRRFLYRAHDDQDRLGSLAALRRHPDEPRERLRHVENVLREHRRFDDTARRALSYDSYKLAASFYSIGMPDFGDTYLEIARGYWSPPVVRGRRSYEILHRVLGCRNTGRLMGSPLYALLRRVLR